MNSGLMTLAMPTLFMISSRHRVRADIGFNPACRPRSGRVNG
jgi:hypothetical protein